MVHTKIIATLGPASAKEGILRKMIFAGLDVVRLNFSHGSLPDHAQHIKHVRHLNKRYRRHIRILQDLEGYRVRIGRFKEKKPLPLLKRQKVLLTNKDILCAGNRLSFDYAGSLKDIPAGTFIYIDDGNIVLRVTSLRSGWLNAEVIIGGMLKEHKGINIPDIKLKFKGLTDKDKRDLEFGLASKVDYIAQSFVRSREDMLALKKYVGQRLPKVKFIAKIENREGIHNLESILDVCDGILIARGDMGVCLPIWEVPVIQKQIIRVCRRRRKIVITATQMLESMTENLRPTRAEVADVANAVFDGTDFVMLSAESAAGKHPVESVAMMNNILRYTEQHLK